MSVVPWKIELHVARAGVANGTVASWIELFYEALESINQQKRKAHDRIKILEALRLTQERKDSTTLALKHRFPVPRLGFYQGRCCKSGVEHEQFVLSWSRIADRCGTLQTNVTSQNCQRHGKDNQRRFLKSKRRFRRV
jgi:hypothetical protein